MDRFILVLTTVPEEKRAQEIAKALVGERLAACVTLSSACQSLYWWEDRIAEDREYILSIKTRASLYPRLEKKLEELHPYDVPEIVALPIQKGSKAYLDWLKKETAG